MQAQGHVQVVDAVVTLGHDPQSALDRARFRVEPDGSVRARAGALGRAPPSSRHAATASSAPTTPHDFGVGQMILDLGEALVGGSDGRGDGYAGGL